MVENNGGAEEGRTPGLLIANERSVIPARSLHVQAPQSAALRFYRRPGPYPAYLRRARQATRTLLSSTPSCRQAHRQIWRRPNVLLAGHVNPEERSSSDEQSAPE